MEFIFKLKDTAGSEAVFWQKAPFFKYSKTLKKIFFIVFCLVLLVFLASFILGLFPESKDVFLFGFLTMSFSLSAFFWYLSKFVDSKLKNPKVSKQISAIPEDVSGCNLADFLAFGPAKAASRVLSLAKGKAVSSNQFLYFLILENPKLNFIFNRLMLNPDDLKNALYENVNSQSVGGDSAGFSVDFQDAINKALDFAKKRNHSLIEAGDLLYGLALINPIFKKVLVERGLKPEDIENLTWWLEVLEKRMARKKRFWDYANLSKMGTLAKSWTAGYTITLDQYSIDLTEAVSTSLPEIIGHKQELSRVEEILTERELTNVLIVGEPGTGRKSIVLALAERCFLGESLDELNYKRVVEINMASLLAGIEGADQLEAVLAKILQEAADAGNVILVIDEFHNYVGRIQGLGIVDISGILAPYLRMPQFKIVAVTTYDGLHQNIEKNSSMLALFKKVEVAEISTQETLMFLENLVGVLEQKYKIFISYPALRQIVDLTEKYMPGLPFPEKAKDVLDETAVLVSKESRDKIMLPEHVAEIMTRKTEIPIGEVKEKEKETLLNLEQLIHQRIVNQEEAVREIATAMRRARSEVTVRKGPMGAFLFLGPTGVGKTETSKALAEVYFGSEEKMIRLDMSEYQAVADIPRLLGTQDTPGILTTAVRENPFSIVLLDEIEKAHKNILNLFLQVLDEGFITDGSGRKVDFRNVIVIMTSNAGYQVILRVLNEMTGGTPLPVDNSDFDDIKVSKDVWDITKKRLLDYIFKEEVFRPEFINRFDAMVVFLPLSKKNLFDISQLLLEKLKANIKEKGVEFLITEELKKKIVDLGYSPVFGARAMRRVVQDSVENPLAQALLQGKLARGSKVEVEPENFSLKIS